MSNSPPESEANPVRSKVLELEKFLPYGETLRNYLMEPFVKLADLTALLRARGVFLQGAAKDDLIPILTATLLSPSEFQTLLECRRERDSKEKFIDRTRNWISSRSLMDAAESSVNLDELPFQSTGKCKLIGHPVISAIDGNPDHIAVNFTVQRTRLSNDWSNEETLYTGKVALKKEEVNGKVVVSITHTSPETKDIAEKYAKLIESSLRASGDIGEPSPDDQILFSSFDNTSRAEFLLSLTGRCAHDELSFLKIAHFHALTDTSEAIPEDCRQLIEGFEQLRLKGELHRSAYCRRREIYPFVRFYRMDGRYKFQIRGATGECIVRYEFSDFGASERMNAEFSHEVEVTQLTANSILDKETARKAIQEVVAQFIRRCYSESQSRTESDSVPATESGNESSSAAVEAPAVLL